MTLKLANILVKESKKAFLDLGSRKKERFPNRIVDYYIEYIFDYYIAKNGFEGFKYFWDFIF